MEQEELLSTIESLFIKVERLQFRVLILEEALSRHLGEVIDKEDTE